MQLPGTKIGAPPPAFPFQLMVGVISVVAATALRAAIDPLVHGLPFITYVVAVVLAAWMGGRLAGVASLATSVFAGTYFFVEPRHSFAIADVQGRVAVVAFVIVSGVLLAIVFAWKRNQAALLGAQKVLGQAGQMAHLGAWAVDMTRVGRIDDSPLYWSDETYRIFGYGPRTVHVSNDLFFSRVHPADRERVKRAVAEALAARQPYAIEHRIVRPDGAERVVYEHAEIEYDRAGRPCWMIGAVQDITEQRRTEQILREASDRARRREEEVREKAAELAEANRLKDEFIATVSHELRTPLNAMLGWAELLRERRLGGEAEARAVDVIAGNARRQAQLIEDLLDMSRIVAGKLRLDPRPIDPAAPVAAAIEAILPSAAAKGVVVRPPAAASAATRVFADATRLQQVVWNLLTNAVKFTPRGGQVSVRIQPRAGEVDIVVRDTGTGIPEEFLPHVFDRFRQADSRTTRAHGGLGIGLSIVRHLVEAQGGRVLAESAGENQGATFIVSLPLASGEDARRDAAPFEHRSTEPRRAPCPDSRALRGLRVLAVDDEPDARELTAAMLRQHGAEVTTVGSVDDAIDAVCRWTPDVLVVDIAMPGADGFALLGRLRDLGGTAAGIPAVALTAYAREEDRQHGLANGFRAYLTKPVDEGDLIECVSLARSVRPAGSGDSA